MLKIILYIIIIIVIAGLILFLSACSQFGANPSKSDISRFKKSPQYIDTLEKFDNAIPNLSDKMW